MSQMRDIFFGEFFEELERTALSLKSEDLVIMPPDKVIEAARRRWHEYEPAERSSSFTLVAVDGGVQRAEFSHGWAVSIGRACALIYSPEEEKKSLRTKKRVKIHLGRIFDNRDRAYIPSYVRLIAEYSAARDAAEEVLKDGGLPLVLMDGSLYLSRFPYAEREYLSHPELLAELFESINALHLLGRDWGFPVAALSKDTSVFYLYMALLREILALSGIDGNLADLVARSTSPMSLREKMSEVDRRMLNTLLGDIKPLTDLEVVEASAEAQGFSHPLLLAPSIYYRRGDTVSSLNRRVRALLSKEVAERVIAALEGFFSRPAVALTYWRPRRDGRAFRVDISGSSLGYGTPMMEARRNTFVAEDYDLRTLKEVLDQLRFCFCNDVEYNLPLHQADRLARFDRQLYASRYEPFLIKRMAERGIVLRSRVRELREVTL
jgi:hypothetical protein